MKLSDLLTEHRIPFRESGHHHCRPFWLQIDCPHCSPGWNHWRLGYNLAGKYFSCWLCGKLDRVQVLSRLLAISTANATRLFALIGVETRHDTKTKARGALVLPKGLEPLLPAHRAYLERRGIDPDEAEQKWGVKAIGLHHNRLKWRIWIPIVCKGEVVSWTTRAIGDYAHLRYITAKPNEEVYSSKECLLGEDHCEHTIIVCEGPLDAMRIGPGAVATSGMAYSRAQVRKIARYPFRYVCFDNEDEAQRRAHKLCNELAIFSGETHNIEITAKDPGEADDAEIRGLRNLLSAGEANGCV